MTISPMNTFKSFKDSREYCQEKADKTGDLQTPFGAVAAVLPDHT